MANTNVSTETTLYESWHRYIHDRDLEGLMSLYSEDAVLESTAVLVLEGHTDGVLTGKKDLTKHFASFFAMLPPKPPTEWYRPGPGFTDKDVLIWEYPSEGPSGPQFDVVESMTLRDGLIVYHRVYWGWRSTKALWDKSKERVGDED